MGEKHPRYIDQQIGAATGIECELKRLQNIAGFDAAATECIYSNIFVAKINHRSYRGAICGRLICRFFL